jgi:hypothetical protein
VITISSAAFPYGYVEQWPVTGQKLFYHDDNIGKIGSFTITDVTQSSGNAVITTSHAGGWPSRTYGSTGLRLVTQPAQICTFTSVTGCPEVVDLSNAGAAGLPLYSYSKRSYTGSVAVAEYWQLWGRVKKIVVTVTTAYTGATGSVLASINLQASNVLIKMSDFSNTTWAPVIDLKKTGTRTFDATANTYPVTWTSTAVSAADTLPSQTEALWIPGNYRMTMTDISAESSGTWPAFSIEVITDQGGTMAAWDPSQLGSALRAWYKFDALTGANNSAQPTVADSSGNGFTLSQATSGNQPLLAVNDLNGKNTLGWNGGTTYYQLANAIFSGSAAGSAYIVVKLLTDGGGAQLMDWGSSSSSSDWPYQDGVFYLEFGSTVRKTCGARNVTSTVYRIYSVYSADSDWAFYVDGGTGGSAGGIAPFYSTTTNTVGWRVAEVDLGRNHIGGIFNGWMAEVVFTNAKQSTADRQKMEGYLAWKWGLAGNLSASHPYKAAPP